MASGRGFLSTRPDAHSTTTRTSQWGWVRVGSPLLLQRATPGQREDSAQAGEILANRTAHQELVHGTHTGSSQLNSGKTNNPI